MFEKRSSSSGPENQRFALSISESVQHVPTGHCRHLLKFKFLKFKSLGFADLKMTDTLDIMMPALRPGRRGGA
jgi:hypothetical protein